MNNNNEALAGVRDEVILANIGDGLIVTDGNGVIVKINKSFSDMLGWEASEVYGKKLFDVVPNINQEGSEIAEKDRLITKTLLEKRKITSTDISYKRKDGSVFPVAITVSPIFFENAIIGAVEIFRDITREKEIEREKDQFISSVSHELRTPMSAVKGLVSMMIKGDYGPTPERFRQPLTNVAVSAERQIHLINDLLNISRLQAGRMKFTLSDFPMSKIVNQVVEGFQPAARLKKISLEIKGQSDELVQADDIWVKQILENIIGNAVKFTSQGGVTVSYDIKEDLVLVIVSDTGVGIALSDQEKLFGKFEQPSTPVLNKTIGSGLGLYISREVARKMGGDVSLRESDSGTGSVFVVAFPKSRSRLSEKTYMQLEKDMALALNKKWENK